MPFPTATLNFDWSLAGEYTIPMSTVAELALSDPPPPDVLVFTDAAAGKVGELIREESNPNLKLRVFVSGGGCSGFQYGFTFDEKVEEGDFCVENRGVQLLVDPMSAQYLMGAEIDYKEDLQGAQFVIRNPNAKTTCGCGSSFSA
jgi:iron-sulfur cluster insertion protein